MSTPQHVLDVFRDMSGQSVILSQAVARHVGMRPEDLEVLGAIEQHGPLSAGQLGGLTGLSPAAVTGLIDRLEQAGVAARRHDAADRRRVLVEVSQGAQRIAELYDALGRDTLAVVSRRSAAELGVIADFLQEMHELGINYVAALERKDSPRRRPARRRAPR